MTHTIAYSGEAVELPTQHGGGLIHNGDWIWRHLRPDGCRAGCRRSDGDCDVVYPPARSR